MNVLVTGGGGFLGRRITEMLLDRGDHVRVFGRHHYEAVEQLGAEGCVGDIRDGEATREAGIGAEAVIHCAALAGVWGRRRDFYGVNVRGTANVINCCLENRIRTLVHTSSPSVAIGEDDIEGADESLPYPKRYLAHYPASKAKAEQMVLEADGWEMVVENKSFGAPGGVDSTVTVLRTCAIRPHLIWGPGDPHLVPRMLETAKAGRLRRVGPGTNRVDMTYVDNAAHAHLLALDNLRSTQQAGGKAYFVGDEQPVSLWPWINDLLEELRVAPVTRNISFGAARRVGAIMEGIYTVCPCLGEPRMTRFVATQLAKSHFFSHERAANDLGYKPIVDAETAMSRTLDWLRTRPE
ncbi:MAG: NAD-dependent epimerase/dehydratase family protein [Lentisphaerae bacterium]|jgi:2-alkyl-3-oxoalkanoate reductase|nr:NAD-dependent epimerase/dehydratase family protein [Lentisphaerota bacterium]MBT4823300.1 NAD-dependent epimerase/dehydratase family protein [Lentisphaerota bacterium]MBT5609822.1 NAD-dependent epimerase/dehydratase family protein [Lentisphaerota bacterium]MBT7055140.1 NAD-dependent epimerase/dehydratase family protein [Lentisphaerota bacterium]MBT7846312.1 NAD-dependent epimerase/dehydratase family protein [Lentisphaerota bacterium]